MANAVVLHSTPHPLLPPRVPRGGVHRPGQPTVPLEQPRVPPTPPPSPQPTNPTLFARDGPTDTKCHLEVERVSRLEACSRARSRLRSRALAAARAHGFFPRDAISRVLLETLESLKRDHHDEPTEASAPRGLAAPWLGELHSAGWHLGGHGVARAGTWEHGEGPRNRHGGRAFVRFVPTRSVAARFRVCSAVSLTTTTAGASTCAGSREWYAAMAPRRYLCQPREIEASFTSSNDRNTTSGDFERV